MADDQLRYRDIAVLAGERTDDAWEAMSDSYEFVVRLLIAVLQKRGKVRVPKDWLELSTGFISVATPLPDGTYLLEAVRRGEVRTDSVEGAGRLREKWDRLYVRRSDG